MVNTLNCLRSVSTTLVEKRVEKKLTSHKGEKLHFLHRKVCGLRLVVLQIRNNFTSKGKVANVRKAGRWDLGCYQSLLGEKETLS